MCGRVYETHKSFSIWVMVKGSYTSTKKGLNDICMIMSVSSRRLLLLNTRKMSIHIFPRMGSLKIDIQMKKGLEIFGKCIMYTNTILDMHDLKNVL